MKHASESLNCVDCVDSMLKERDVFMVRMNFNVVRMYSNVNEQNAIFFKKEKKKKGICCCEKMMEARTTNINRFTKCVFYCVFHRIVSFCLSATNESYHFRPLCLYFCAISNFFFCAGTSVKNTPPRFRRPRARLPRRFHLVRKIQDRRRRRR